MKKIVVVSGGFDPLHSGHVSMLAEAKQLGDKLIVALNSDAWLTRKKGKPFMSYNERSIILAAVRYVDEVIPFNDDDGSAVNALESLQELYPTDKIIFANGGDRTKKNIPELTVEGVKFVYGVGGKNKTNASSTLLENWAVGRVERDWGWWSVIKTYPGVKVKELVVNPGEQLSKQRHQHRRELWTVLSGVATVVVGDHLAVLEQGDETEIDQGLWHQLLNKGESPLHVLEVQLGVICEESDIERK
jgi:glycerol-3-phosphate cytidylyltransferase